MTSLASSDVGTGWAVPDSMISDIAISAATRPSDTGHADPVTEGGSGGSRSALLRGEAAASATPVEVLDRATVVIEPTGPWAAHLDDARDEASKTGFSQGLEEGRDAGRRAAEDAANARSAQAVSALDQLIAGLEARGDALETEFSEEVTALALTVAEAILSRELAVTADPGKEAIARCLLDAPRGGEVVAYLNPKDIESLGHLESILDGRPISIIPDFELDRGDAIVEVGDTRIDGRLAEAMDRVREVLR